MSVRVTQKQGELQPSLIMFRNIKTGGVNVLGISSLDRIEGVKCDLARVEWTPRKGRIPKSGAKVWQPRERIHENSNYEQSHWQRMVKKISELERDLGITPGLLAKWKSRMKTDGEQAFPGKGRLKEDDELIRRLQRENEQLRQEREVLKKVRSIFSREQPCPIDS